MLAQNDIEDLICLIATWDRPTLISQFSAFPSKFPVDFSYEFLSGLSEDRLRHVLFALYMQNQKSPGESSAAA